MNICSCGNVTVDSSVQCPRCAALHLLGVGINATKDEIKDAYRVLVKVWHPDRFPTDQKLREAAEAKLKEINSAFLFLTSTSANAAARASSPQQQPDSAQSSTRKRASIVIPSWIPPLQIWPTLKFLFKVAAVALVLLLGRYLWIAFDVPDPATGQIAQIYGFSKENLLKGLEAPKRRFLDAVERDMRRLDPRSSASAPAASPQAEPPAPLSALGRQPEKIHSASRPAPAAPPMIRSYLTVGSTRDEVLAQQGTPTASSEYKLVYGKSELYFKDNTVIGWRIDPGSSVIRVKLWPQSSVDPDLGSFTVGSSKDEVLVVQGTPTAFTEDKFEYGNSAVNFRKNRVVSWKEDPSSIPLRAR
jgi:hypothetical protein